MGTHFTFTWDAPEFIDYYKPVSWYWISMIAAIILLAYAMWQKNFLFGFFLVVAEILFLVWGNRESQSRRFELSERGLTIDGKKRYSLSDIATWSVDVESHAEWVSVWFNFKGRIRTNLKMHLHKDRVAELRETFGSIVREIEHEHTMIDALETFIGF